MKNIICLSIEIKREKSKAPQFYFNETMVQAMLSGLTVVYDEVFIWSCQNRLAVWAVGDHSDFLVQAFVHHRSKFKTIQLLEGDLAVDHFQSIVDGKKWPAISTITKLETILKAFELSESLNSLSQQLHPLVFKGISSLRESPVVTGSRNSWTSSGKSFLSGITEIRSTDLFYRFSIN
jgi:hypothetical protein